VASGGSRRVFDKRVGDFPLRGRIITMADRYQDRSFPGGNDYNPDDGSHGPPRAESDPLAELARLIGQTDPFGTGSIGRANLPVQPHARPQSRPTYEDDYELPPQAEEAPPPGPPSWMQRAARQEAPPPQQDYPSEVHPLHRYAATHPPLQSDYDPEPSYADADHETDPARYDDALYGSYDQGAQGFQHDQAYADDDYAYDEELGAEPMPEPKRRGGMITVAAVLALAVFGVGGAFAYRTYTGSARNGEPPIIRADAGPTKIIPSPPDGATKVPDRMTPGDGMERIVSREETPLDPNAKSIPRVVWPTPNLTGNPPPASVAPAAPPPVSSANGTLPNSEPHRIKTLSVRGDQADAGVPAGVSAPPTTTAKPAPRAAATATQRTASAANASASAPLSLSPQANAAPAAAAANDSQVRVATTNPVQTAPSGGPSSGGYLVQVSSQRSEADAEASYKSLQGKFPSVLGSHTPVIKRADLGEKGVYYRAMVGPFTSPEEASQLCGSLKSAGGQCVVQRN
jgi:sporulation related protein